MGQRTMSVRIEQIGAAAFEATSPQGGSLTVDGSPDIGGEGRGMRPMEVLLSAMATCSAMDVVHILRKQREPLEHLSIDIEGTRVDATPAPFSSMQLTFVARGKVDPHKLERAVALAVEKYCSVGATLSSEVEIRWEARVE